MKIGLLTYYGDLNCGTNLQAYASLKAIREHYPHAHTEIIPFHGFRNRIRPYLSDATITSLLKDWRRIKSYKKFRQEELGVVNDNTITDIEQALQFIKNQQYDLIFIGADTLLELDRLPQESQDITAYWLSPDIPSHKILLAASCKNVEYNKLHPTQKEKLGKAIASFDAMGVRDITTYDLLTHYVDESRIRLIPDPTFALDIDYTPIEQYLKAHNIAIPTKSICFHTYRTDGWAKACAEQLKQKGYTIVSLRPARWADIVLNGLSPLEQLGVYRYFSLIITHRFHDSIFALKNGTPPLTYVADTSYTTHKGNSKCSTLIRQFDLFPHHIITGKEHLTATTFVEKAEQILRNFDTKREGVAQHIKQFAQEYHRFIDDNLIKV